MTSLQIVGRDDSSERIPDKILLQAGLQDVLQLLRDGQQSTTGQSRKLLLRAELRVVRLLLCLVSQSPDWAILWERLLYLQNLLRIRPV